MAVVHFQKPLCIFVDLEEALGGQPLKFETTRKGQKGLIARSRSTATEQTKKGRRKERMERKSNIRGV